MDAPSGKTAYGDIRAVVLCGNNLRSSAGKPDKSLVFTIFIKNFMKKYHNMWPDEKRVSPHVVIYYVKYLSGGSQVGKICLILWKTGDIM